MVGHGGSDSLTDKDDITGTNDAPVVASTDVSGAVTELVTPVGNLTDSGTIAFTDVDLTDAHSISAVTPSAGALGTLTASVSTDTTGSGLGGVVTWNYSVAAGAVEYLAAGQHKIETFSFDVLDGQGGSVSRTVSVDISGTNDAPVISSGSVGSEAENSPIANVVYSATAIDVDTSDTIAGFVLGGADASLFDISASGAVTFKVSPDFEAPADAGHDNVYNITVAA